MNHSLIAISLILKRKEWKGHQVDGKGSHTFLFRYISAPFICAPKCVTYSLGIRRSLKPKLPLTWKALSSGLGSRLRGRLRKLAAPQSSVIAAVAALAALLMPAQNMHFQQNMQGKRKHVLGIHHRGVPEELLNGGSCRVSRCVHNADVMG